MSNACRGSRRRALRHREPIAVGPDRRGSLPGINSICKARGWVNLVGVCFGRVARRAPHRACQGGRAHRKVKTTHGPEGGKYIHHVQHERHPLNAAMRELPSRMRRRTNGQRRTMTVNVTFVERFLVAHFMDDVTSQAVLNSRMSLESDRVVLPVIRYPCPHRCRKSSREMIFRDDQTSAPSTLAL